MNEPEKLLAPLHLTAGQHALALAAWKENPEGVERCATDALATGRAPGALFATMIASGEHKREPNGTSGKRITGWRWVRGSHSGRYVEDPKGTDNPPPGYDTTTKGGARETREIERVEVWF